MVVVSCGPGRGHGTPPALTGEEATFAGPFVSIPVWTTKRVAAAPGDRLPNEVVPALSDVPETVVPRQEFVVLGDNSSRSYDSREHGYVEASRLLGVVVRIVRGSGLH
ncbi:S26 family signal peptidase [[Actinomadura] parvosata]|uniref:S26 family signal peptidase n=1 Tax=[Actinomadura] parvosata TaxID=1955412 RepID=UPI00406CD793